MVQIRWQILSSSVQGIRCSGMFLFLSACVMQIGSDFDDPHRYWMLP